MGGTSIAPFVGVVIVNYHGDDLTIACLEQLSRTIWPANRLETVVVDNGSSPGFAERAEATGAVRVLASGRNLGFPGACNLGLRALAHCHHVALVNNDVLVDDGWLAPLVEAIDRTGAGAATPKVLLQGRWLRASIAAAPRSARGDDSRTLGVQLSGAKVDHREVLHEAQLAAGFWGWESDEVTVGGRFTWTNADATLWLPAPAGAQGDPGSTGHDVPVELRLSSGLGPTSARVGLDGIENPVEVQVHPKWIEAGRAGSGKRLINNAGTRLRPDGSVVDRGFLQADDGDFDEPREVFGWSGTAVLLSRAYLDDVGPFDDRYFLYYEDSELSWRGRLRGWGYHYAPESKVWHAHSATVGEASPLARHLVSRNRLLTLSRHAPRRMAIDAAGRSAADLGTTIWRDLLRRPLALQRPVSRHAVDLGRVLVGAARLLPGTLLARRASGVADSARVATIAPWLREPG